MNHQALATMRHQADLICNAGRDRAKLGQAYKFIVGYDPFEDDPTQSELDVQMTLMDYVREDCQRFGIPITAVFRGLVATLDFANDSGSIVGAWINCNDGAPVNESGTLDQIMSSVAHYVAASVPLRFEYAADSAEV